jgi:tetratricopeptide (TPR) repeat protein
MTRRLDEALVEARKSLQLNPLSRSANYALHWVLHDRGQFGRDMREYDRAIDHLKQMREFDPDFMDATVLIGWLYLHKSQIDPSPIFYEEAIQEFSKVPNLSPDTGSWWTFGCFSGLVWAYARSGKKEEAKKIQHQIQEFSKTHYVGLQWLANIHLGLGENDEAIQLLEKAYDQREYDSLNDINVEPMFEAIHSDPRFVALLKKIGLDEFGNLAIPSG